MGPRSGRRTRLASAKNRALASRKFRNWRRGSRIRGTGAFRGTYVYKQATARMSRDIEVATEQHFTPSELAGCGVYRRKRFEPYSRMKGMCSSSQPPSPANAGIEHSASRRA